MPQRDPFKFVPLVLREEKYFDTSRAELERHLRTKGKIEVITEHTIADSCDPVDVKIRLNLNCRAPHPEAWTASLKISKMRIDCVDFEESFSTMSGAKSSGWHRHRWDHAGQHAETHKEPIAAMDGIDCIDQFLIRIMQVMKIRLNHHDHGTAELQFD